jgi:cytochrome c heme-lyase
MWFSGSQASSSSSKTEAPVDPDICPVDEGTRKAWLARQNGQDSTAGQVSNSSSAMALLNTRHDSHKTVTVAPSNLSRDRVTSSIPRWAKEEEGSPEASSSSSPKSTTSSNWVYPSPNQFYSAMSRKNHNPRAEDMNVVVPIHNAVNERAWKEILEWERMGDERSWESCGGPKLVSFKGRPKDITWKAWSRSWLG